MRAQYRIRTGAMLSGILRVSQISPSPKVMPNVMRVIVSYMCVALIRDKMSHGRQSVIMAKLWRLYCNSYSLHLAYTAGAMTK